MMVIIMDMKNQKGFCWIICGYMELITIVIKIQIFINWKILN